MQNVLTDAIFNGASDCAMDDLKEEQKTQHLLLAILKFVKSEWEGGFRFNAQPIDRRMDVFEVTPIPGLFWQEKRTMITIRNLRTGEIEYRYRDVALTYEKLKKFLIDWLTAVEDVHGNQCFERHVQWRNNPEGRNWFVEIPVAE